MTMSRKKLINLSLLFVLLLIIAVVALQLLSKNTNPIDKNTISEIQSAPAVITVDERHELGIGDDVQLEVINRNSNGRITTYRLIK
jgi:hypothetical protein